MVFQKPGRYSSDSRTAANPYIIGKIVGRGNESPTRLQSRGLESLTAGLQSLRLASRLKSWLRTIDGLRWQIAASYGLRLQIRKLTTANQHMHFHINVSHLLFGPGPKIFAKQVRGSRASVGLQVKWRQELK